MELAAIEEVLFGIAMMVFEKLIITFYTKDSPRE
jgi:hypothetical protein